MQTKPKPTNKKKTPNKQVTLNPYCLVPVHMQRSTIVPEGKRTKILQDEEQNNTPTPKTKHKNQQYLFYYSDLFQISDLHIIAWPSLQNNFLLSSQPTKTKRSHSPLLVKIRLSFNRAVQTPQGESHRQIQDQELAKNVPEIKTKYQKKMQRPPVELGTCENFPSLAFHHLLFLTTIIPSWAKKHVSM